MIDGYRVVSVCPAGRRRYLELLVPYLLRERGLIDRHEWWVNTTVREDLVYLESLANEHPSFFRLVPLPHHHKAHRWHTNLRIGLFFPGCLDAKTIYLRVDDDIVYVAPGAFRRLLEFRVANPTPFLVYPSIVNNACLSHVHQRQNAFGTELGTCAFDAFGLGWRSGELAELVHRSFLRALEQRDVDRWRFHELRLSRYERVAINCISWFGRDMAAFGGRVDGDEEQFLACRKPAELRRPNSVCGEALVAHFAYWKQRPHLDATDLLEAYRAWVPSELGARNAKRQAK